MAENVVMEEVISGAIVRAVCGAEDPYGAIRQLQEMSCGS